MNPSLPPGLLSISSLLIFATLPGSDGIEYKNDLKERYPDYGETWMYMPDGQGVPQVVNLTDESEHNTARGLFSNKADSIYFHLYTRNNPDNYSELIWQSNDENSNTLETGTPFNDPYFDSKKDVKIVIHGFQSSGFSNTVINIKDAYLNSRDLNVVIVDWEYLANNLFYFSSAADTQVVGNKTGSMILYLITEHMMRPEQFHLVGHSLGAHASGYAGSYVQTESIKVARISGLDPALPGFEYWAKPPNRLDPDDAQFVDVIHTCAGVLGYLHPLGHADFYPNGGKPSQPGCSGLAEIIEACSHGRSWEFFAESIPQRFGFLSRECVSDREVRSGNCTGPPTSMGDQVPADTRGIFYVTTNAKKPYARNTDDE